MDIALEFIKYIDNLSDLDRYAYLGMTAKIENPIRDDFAYYLHKKYHESYTVGREYSVNKNTRMDIVVKDLNRINLCIEFKACYSFDILPNNDNYKKHILSDYLKYVNIPHDYDVYFILLNIRYSELPNSNLVKIVKYLKPTISGFNKIEPARQYEIQNNIIRDWFKYENRIEVIDSGTKMLGKAFSVQNHIDYYIFKGKYKYAEQSLQPDSAIVTAFASRIATSVATLGKGSCQ